MSNHHSKMNQYRKAHMVQTATELYLTLPWSYDQTFLQFTIKSTVISLNSEGYSVKYNNHSQTNLIDISQNLQRFQTGKSKD